MKLPYRPRLEVWADEDAWQPPRRHPEDPMGFWSSTCQAAGVKPKNDWLAPPTTGQNDFEYFLDCVEQGRRSDVSADVGADTTKVLMAAYESSEKGGAFVDLSEFVTGRSFTPDEFPDPRKFGAVFQRLPG